MSIGAKKGRNNMEWPKPESNMIPEGHYLFRLREEPEMETFAFTDKKGKDRQGTKMTFFAVGTNDTGEFDVRESLFVWDKRYADLCVALNVDHGKDIRVTGEMFQADIIHEPDKKDPTKTWPRIINILPHIAGMEFPEAAGSDDDDNIPF
jgi:hypothetical protein